MGHYAAVLGSVEQEEKQGVLQEVAQSEEGRNRLRGKYVSTGIYLQCECTKGW